MNFKKAGFVMSLVLVGVATVAMAADAHGFGGHGHGRHGPSAIMSCIVVMSPSQKAELRQTFKSHKDELKSAWQDVQAAKRQVNLDTISDSGKLGDDQANLSSAQSRLLKAKDSLAREICGKLSAKQKTAAAQLYTNLLDLHKKTHEQAKNYFKEARAAAGVSETKPAASSEKHQ